MLILLLLFVVLPLIEINLLLAMGDWMGTGATLAWVLVTGVLGAILARRQRLQVFRDWQAAISSGRMPEEGVVGSVLVLVGGVLLVTPGVITDFAGLLLMMPRSRRWIAIGVRRWLETKLSHSITTSVAMPSMGDPFSAVQRGSSRINVVTFSSGFPGVHSHPGHAPTMSMNGKVRGSHPLPSRNVGRKLADGVIDVEGEVIDTKHY